MEENGRVSLELGRMSPALSNNGNIVYNGSMRASKEGEGAQVTLETTECPLNYISDSISKEVSKRQISELHTRYMKRRRRYRPRPTYMWETELVLNFYAKGKPDNESNLEELNTKGIMLTCLFTACRPR